MQKLPKLIVIVAPTASGKTEISIKLARKFNGEIVSADSRAIYKWMDIGTAKSLRDKTTELPPYGRQAKPLIRLACERAKMRNYEKHKGYFSEGIRHHLIDVVRPDEEFALTDFKNRATRAISDIIKRRKTPFLVGGTGLYIQAVVDNLQIPQVAPDKKLRKKLEKKTKKQLFAQLKKLDPKSAEQIGLNQRKLIRALEVCIKTDRKFSELTKKGEPLFDVLQIGISHPREELYRRINLRAEKMVEEGLIEEVKSIVKKLKKVGTGHYPIHVRKIWQLPSMSGIGYKQVGMHLRGEIDLNEAVRLIQRDTRHYAKRQIAWFKRDKRIKWVKTYKEAERIIKKYLEK